ncbi:MAG: T9SS type A sorting domain-containing protein [bacterium]|nr:MAG: T9SS type A sorting domain-containing protein [bacterium]
MRKKTYLILWLAILLLIPAYIFAWGSATHAYFADQLGKSWGYLNRQEMYGSMAPDMFNPFFGSRYFNYLRIQIHEQFDKVVNHARAEGLKAFAYGFASHNDVWGADFTAHYEGRTTPGIGYVSAQINALAPAFQDSIEQVLLDNNIDSVQAKEIATEFASFVAHGLVEVAIDILVKRNEDSKIGKKILWAAQFHSPAVPGLLVAAYAADIAQEFDTSLPVATGGIVGAEKVFKEFIGYYGYIFTKNEPEITRRLIVYGADLAELHVKAVKGLDIIVPQKTVAGLLALAIVQVESSYAAEISATLTYLENELPLHGINSQSQPVAWQTEEENETALATKPQNFSLAQNQPNPFKPITTINYSLAEDSYVRITIYNTLWQVVAVLVEGYQTKGSHSVVWNAHDQSSGLYVYRLEAGGFTTSKKMFFQK